MMLRFLFTIVLVVYMAESTFAIVESVEFQSTITSEKTTRPATDCADGAGDATTRLGVIELEDCGISATAQLSDQNRGDFRIFRRARSQYGWAEMLFTRRVTPPWAGRSVRGRALESLLPSTYTQGKGQPRVQCHFHW